MSNDKMATTNTLNDIIALNVGGTRFETTRQTLLHDPTSMLARMFDPVSPLQSGDYFIVFSPLFPFQGTIARGRPQLLLPLRPAQKLGPHAGCLLYTSDAADE